MNRRKCPNDVGVLIGYVEKRIVKEINKNLVNFNLTATQEKVLWTIFHGQQKGEVYQKDIEKELESSNPTVTGIVKRLEEKKMIKRVCSNEDCRYKSLTLTEEGLKIIEMCMDYGANYIEKKLIKNMDSTEIDLLKKLLKKVINNMEQ